MDTPLRTLCRRVERDFTDPRLHFPEIRLIPASEWPGVHPPSNPPPGETSAYQDTDLVCVSGGHSFLIDGSLDDETLVASIASSLQDDAIDALGAPWPSLQVGGVFRGVLEPEITSHGVAVWATQTGFSCPVGELHATFGVGTLIA